MKLSVKALVKAAVLCALSIVLVTFIHFPLLPGAPFLEYDPADIPLLMVSLMYGPWCGLLATAVVSAIQGFTVSTASGWVGIVMHIIATGALTVVTGLLYRRNGKLASSLIFGVLAMLIMMIPSNLIFTVHYMKTPIDAVIAMLPTVILPFNLIKGVLNALIAGVLYAKLSKTNVLG